MSWAPHEFQGQRDAFEASADDGGGRRMRRGGELHAGGGGSGPLGEQGERVVVAGTGQRADLGGPLADDVQRLPAGDQYGHGGGGGQQIPEEVAAGVDEMLARVQDQQQPFVGEPFAQHRHRRPGRVVGQPDGVADAGHQPPRAL